MEILRAADVDGNGTINYTGKLNCFYFRVSCCYYGCPNFLERVLPALSILIV